MSDIDTAINSETTVVNELGNYQAKSSSFVKSEAIKLQILQQAASAFLTQANSALQAVCRIHKFLRLTTAAEGVLLRTPDAAFNL